MQLVAQYTNTYMSTYDRYKIKHFVVPLTAYIITFISLKYYYISINYKSLIMEVSRASSSGLKWRTVFWVSRMLKIVYTVGHNVSFRITRSSPSPALLVTLSH